MRWEFDPSKDGIAHALRVNRLGNCTFSEGLAESLHLPDASYDVVVNNLMIHHLSEPLRSQAIREMFRVLRPGGRLLIAEFQLPAKGIRRRLMGPMISPVMRHNPVHLLEPMVQEAGFEQIRGGNLAPWTRYVQAVKPTKAH